jgi:DNA polymerase-3 subunit alpha
MSDDGFVHLHLHTEYSLLDGAVRVGDAIKACKRNNMPAVALTDHGNLYGVVPFFQAAKKAGVKPIIGCELYVAPGSMTDKQASSAKEAAYHVTLLAETLDGYHNLVKLVSAAHLDGFYYKPRVDHALMAQHSNGLICLSGCLKGEINSALMAGQPAKAKDLVGTYRDIFGPQNFFLELHDHGIEAQAQCSKALVAMAPAFGLPLVGSNDVHFLDRSHHEAHDVMICIGTGSMVDDEKRMRYVPELYFKSAAEMRSVFSEIPEACDNTLRIAERCNVELEFGKTRYPDYLPPEGKTREQYLRELCYEGLVTRFGERARTDPTLTERLEYELGVLERTGFVSYFLIVWDFIHYAKSKGIPVGPGRGSAAGSLIAYVLGITDLDPLRFGLIFERFLNPDRVSPPDIDIDFCQDRRGEVIEYVRRKYGTRAVAQIITFGTLGAKSVVRDVGRVIGLSYGEADRIARMIPNELGITLVGEEKDGQRQLGAIDKNPELKKAVETEASTQRLWSYATTLEGISRNTGIHAAGVVISDRDLSDYIPLTRGNDEEVVTQFAMGPLTDLGLLKMDFLGLKTLTVLHDAVRIIKTTEPDFALESIPFEDQRTFDMLNRGETVGVFQLESGGMVNLCRQFDISTIDDIIALIALYRPGPMDLIPDYIKRKKGLTPIRYEHPLLEQICADTFGVLIYQEQVQRAANLLAGYTLGEADLLRRAMGKKDKEKMAQERSRFISGCAEVNKIPEKKANDIFDLLEKFAGYGFNKSHSAAYGLLSYQTGWLKANHPVAFMAATLSNEINNTDKISILVAECHRMNIKILPPDMNRSSLKFVPEKCDDGTDGIRYGLAAIKNVGGGAVEAAINARESRGPFKSLEDFASRVDTRSVNKKVLESLIKCGAFDFCNEPRAVLFSRLDGALAAAASMQRDRMSGQVSLFGEIDSAPQGNTARHASEMPDWTQELLLSFEKDLLGFYVTGHPLDPYRDFLMSDEFVRIAELGAETDVPDEMSTPDNRRSAGLKLAGALASCEKKFTRKDGKPFVIAILEDLTGSIEVTFWSEAYTRAAALLDTGRIVWISGRLDTRSETKRFIASEAGALNSLSGAKTKKKPTAIAPVRLRFDARRDSVAALEKVESILIKYPGPRPVEMDFECDGRTVARLRAAQRFSVQLTPELAEILSPWIEQ